MNFNTAVNPILPLDMSSDLKVTWPEWKTTFEIYCFTGMKHKSHTHDYQQEKLVLLFRFLGPDAVHVIFKKFGSPTRQPWKRGSEKLYSDYIHYLDELWK